MMPELTMRINLSTKYILFTTLILLVVIGFILAFISRRHEQLVMAQIETQAKALFNQIVITRRWVADHGGVFVEKLPWVKTNPYLFDSVVRDTAGKLYVKKNPAMATKELSRYAEKDGLYFFRVTSLKPINPENAPDEFEASALRDFESQKTREASGVYQMGDSSYFRFIAPLHVEEACLQCHAKQGYKIGDVRGGISVGIPMDYALATMKRDRNYMVIGGIAAAALLMSALFLMTRRMVLNPVARIRSQMAGFPKEGKREIPLIRTGDELEDLSRSFREMAKIIDDYQSSLHVKIDDATRELTEKNEMLVRLHKTKSDFIARVSHELRTPLTSIKGAMDYLSVRLSMRGTDEDRELHDFVQVVKKNADRLIRMVKNVLDYERIETGNFQMHFCDVNLKDLVHEAAAEFLPFAEEKQVQILVRAADVVATADEDRIKQVLTNFLSNALRASPESSSINLVVETRNDDVEIAVEDRGCGVPESERELIFRQFYTKDTKSGTGLGLAICKSIVEAHDGQIGVESPPSGGCRFWFRFPRAGRKGE